jgi:hypothetical protein
VGGHYQRGRQLILWPVASNNLGSEKFASFQAC